MITKEELTPRLLDACPSFVSVYDADCADYEKELPYLVSGYFAQHLQSLFVKEETSEFPAVAEMIEALHIDGDKYTKDFATIGILESIQCSWNSKTVPAENFYSFLLPVSQKWWNSLNDFHSKKVPYVGFGIEGP